MHRLTQSAFADYGRLEPPSGAILETEASIRADLEAHGGAVALSDRMPVGCLRFERRPDHLHVRRVAVDPAHQGQGIGRALMEWIHDYARREGFAEVRVGVRVQLPGNRRFYECLGYTLLQQHTHEGYAQPTWEELRLQLP